MLRQLLQRYSYNFLSKLQGKRNYHFDYKYPNQSELKKMGHSVILADDNENSIINPDNQFSFNEYCKAIISIVNGSHQKCSIGIYGDWGTGKTTLMKLVEKNLKPPIFCWEDVPGNDSNKLKDYLIKNFDGITWGKKDGKLDIKWINDESLKFQKVGKEGKIITINESSNIISIILEEEKKRAILEIDHLKVYEFFAEREEKILTDHSEQYDSRRRTVNVKENNILTIWFDAWRYEREEHFAVIPLIKTIAYGMGEHQTYRHIKPILLRGIGILSKDIIRNLATRYLLTSEGMKQFEQKLIPKIQRLPEIDKNTIYFDGLKKVEEEIEKIQNGYPESRVVVFIDDLDRCSPDIALQVFESVKVFLDIKGFVFIVGLSDKILTKMIKIKFQKEGLTDIEEKEGLTDIEEKEYIRKIIQLEINIPTWNNDSIKELIVSLSQSLDDKHSDSVKKSRDFILELVKQNPRRTKRFINNFVVASSAKPNLNGQVYFMRELIESRWEKFYETLSSNENYRDIVEKYVKISSSQEREKALAEAKDIGELPDTILNVLKGDKQFWAFLDVNDNKKLFSEIIKEWRTYESAAESVKISEPLSWERARKKAITLLKNGNIGELNKLFGELRRLYGNKTLDLSKASLSHVRFVGDFSGINFSRADLSYASIEGADFVGTNFSGADLSHMELGGGDSPFANFSEANFSGAIFVDAHLYYADYVRAVFIGAHFERANLSNSDYSMANFSDVKLVSADINANFSEANFSNAVIIGCRGKPSCNGSDFMNAVIDDRNMVEYLNKDKTVKNAPNVVNNRKELQNRLEEKGFSDHMIESMLSCSLLK